MKGIILSALVFSVLLFSCGDQKNNSSVEADVVDTVSAEPKVELTTMEFDHTQFDFGEIEQGDTVVHTFSFTNTGNHDLVISNVRASCGCTVSNWTKQPVKPGQKGVVDVRFNSGGRKDLQNKVVTVKANIEQEVIKLRFTAFVVKKQDNEE